MLMAQVNNRPAIRIPYDRSVRSAALPPQLPQFRPHSMRAWARGLNRVELRTAFMGVLYLVYGATG